MAGVLASSRSWTGVPSGRSGRATEASKCAGWASTWLGELSLRSSSQLLFPGLHRDRVDSPPLLLELVMMASTTGGASSVVCLRASQHSYADGRPHCLYDPRPIGGRGAAALGLGRGGPGTIRADRRWGKSSVRVPPAAPVRFDCERAVPEFRRIEDRARGSVLKPSQSERRIQFTAGVSRRSTLGGRSRDE
jgi:hypothetical protein